MAETDAVDGLRGGDQRAGVHGLAEGEVGRVQQPGARCLVPVMNIVISACVHVTVEVLGSTQISISIRRPTMTAASTATSVPIIRSMSSWVVVSATAYPPTRGPRC